MRTFAAILLIATSPALFAQSSPALPGCEPRPEVRQVLDEKLSEKILQEMYLWSKPPSAKIQELAENGWRKPGKDMPAFELADLSGRTWRLKDLAGRPVLINVWATWCGTCQRELPHMEKLYRKLKDRSDLQILTLTIDEDLGAVAPFMKEKGYTFPVLPAYSFVTGLLDLVGIPQNWIVDSKGEWRWTGAPAVPDAEWEDAMLKQLESVR